MTATIFSVDTLLESYIEVTRYRDTVSEVGKARLNYYLSRMRALEQALGVTLSEESFNAHNASRWWWLFRKTVTSYLNSSTPLDGMFEASAWLSEPQIADQVDVIHQATKVHRKQHFVLLQILIQLVFGSIDKHVTGDDLIELGFDYRVGLAVDED